MTSGRRLPPLAAPVCLAIATIPYRIERKASGDGRAPGVIIDGRRVNWTDFDAMLMLFEGWQFRFELVDPADDA